MIDDEQDDGLLHINGKTCDTDDLTYAERREIKRIVKAELWDEELYGEWTDFTDVPNDDYMAATVLVFLRRDDPSATVDDALAFKPERVLNGDPPTKLVAKQSPARRSTAAKASATSGPPS